MEISGHAAGAGTYVATKSGLSIGFVDRDAGPAVMGIVQVIHAPQVRVNRDALVVPDNVLVELRFVAVYPNEQCIPHIH